MIKILTVPFTLFTVSCSNPKEYYRGTTTYYITANPISTCGKQLKTNLE